MDKFTIHKDQEGHINPNKNTSAPTPNKRHSIFVFPLADAQLDITQRQSTASQQRHTMDAPPMTTKQHQEAAALGSGSGAANSGPTGLNSGAVASHQSPRNTMTGSGGGVAWQMGTVEVSKALQDGEKFVKWDEVSGTDVAAADQKPHRRDCDNTPDTDQCRVCAWAFWWGWARRSDGNINNTRRFHSLGHTFHTYFVCKLNV